MAGKNIRIVIEGEGESARKALEMVQENLRETAETAREQGGVISEAMERVGRALEYVGIYMGIREAIDGLKEMVAGSVELGMEMGHLSQQTGISTENLSILKYAAEQTGVGFEDVTKGFRKFSVDLLNAQEGQKSAVQTFARLGITQREVKESGNDMLGMLGLVADRFKTLPDGPQKAAEVVALFGRSGMALIPMLNLGSEGIQKYASEARALGIVLDEEGVRKMEALHQATVRVESAFEGAALGLTGAMEPALANLENALAGATGKTDAFSSAGNWLGGVMTYAAEAVAYLVKFIRQAYDEYEALGALVNGTERKIASVLDVGTAARDRAAAGYQDQVAKEKAALKDREQAEQDYHDFVAKLQAVAPKAGEVQRGSGALDPQSQGSKAHGENGLAQAATDLANEQARAVADAQKNATDVQLAELEAQHKMLLVSDAQFYAERLRLQNEALDAQQGALIAKQEDLQALLAKQHADKTVKRDGNGNSAEELRTQRELLQVQEQLGSLETQRARNSSAATADQDASNRATELASLKAAADLEKQRNSGIEAQIALIRKEHELEAQKIKQQGGSDADAGNVTAAGELAVKQLQAEQAYKNIEQALEANRLATQRWNDEAEKNPFLKGKAEKAINQLNAQTAASVKQLVAQYEALAEQIGGPTLEAAKKLSAEVQKMSVPDHRQADEAIKKLTESISGMANSLIEKTVEGKESFHKMAQDIEKDALELALKLAENKILSGLMGGDGVSGGGGGAGGGSGGGGGIMGGLLSSLLHLPGFAEGGDPTGLSVVGEKGPELFMPKGPGTVIPNAAVQKLAEGGGGGRGVNITSNVINQTSNPVQAQPSQVSYDSQLKTFQVQTILEDMAQGGPISQAMRGVSNS